jgi:hypothetical protein
LFALQEGEKGGDHRRADGYRHRLARLELKLERDVNARKLEKAVNARKLARDNVRKLAEKENAQLFSS